MWLVDITGRNAEGAGLWHYAAREDDALLACGIRNPRWHFRWDGQAWQEAESSVPGIAVRKWHDDEALRELSRLPQHRRCVRCWRDVEREMARREHEALVSVMLAAGKPEVTADCLVIIRDLADGEEIACCFQPSADLPEEVCVCSPTSPLSAALLGRFVGEEVAVELPQGRTLYAIVQAEPLRTSRIE